MKYRIQLHTHIQDDPKDVIPYSCAELLESAAQQKFHAIAITCHDHFTSSEKYEEEAKKRNICIISGIEKRVEGKDILILNCDDEIETIDTFEKLKKYRSSHPDIFIIAPHPYFPSSYPLHEMLDAHIELFDAIEHSWFYTKFINFNTRAEQIATHYSLPYVATSDLHILSFLQSGYIEIDADECSPSRIFRAIREKKFQNIAAPKSLWKLIWYVIRFNTLQMFHRKK